MKKDWSFWMMFGLAVLIIIFWFITVFHPWKFWWIINVSLWIILLFCGISAILSAIRNPKTRHISFLFIIGILVVILWIMLIWAKEVNFVGRLMIWIFALWAFMRWWILIFFWIQNKWTTPLWRWISTLGWILVFLAILTAISSARMANLVWICIWISIIFDGASLLFLALKWWNNIQTQIIAQADQNEIAQWEVVVTQTTVSGFAPEVQKPDDENHQ